MRCVVMAKAERITITNVPSFADKLGCLLEVEGVGTLTVDTAYGGDSFVIVDATAMGFEIVPEEACDLVETGMKITVAANEQLGFRHPLNAEWNHLSFCQFAGPLVEDNASWSGRTRWSSGLARLIGRPRARDVQPEMAVLHAQDECKSGIGIERGRSLDPSSSVGLTR